MIKLLLILFLCIICFSFLRKSENYSNIDDVIIYDPSDKPNNRKSQYRKAYINCLLPIPDESDGQYIGTFNFNDMKESHSIDYKRQYKTNNLIITYSLESQKWSKTPLENGGIDGHVIKDLNWSRDDTSTGLNSKRLMCVAMNNNNKYTIYIKETDSITSKWTKYFTEYLNKETEPEGNIKCIRFNLANNNIIGISNTDNQIYKYNQGLNKWIGPINFNKEFKIEKLLFNFDRKLIAITDNFVTSIYQCAKDNKEIIFVNLNLQNKDTVSHSSHANGLIFNTIQKTIERFDPHGPEEYIDPDTNMKKYTNPYYDQVYLDYKMKEKFETILPEYTYLGINEICPVIGPQIKTDAFKGLCLTWTLMYTLLRILNPRIKPEVITKKMSEGSRDDILNKILRFNRYVIDVLRKQKKSLL